MQCLTGRNFHLIEFFGGVYLDPQLQLSTWLKENEQVPQLEVPLLPEKPNLQNEDGAGSMRSKLVKEGACAFMPSHPGVRSKHHRVDSPVCIRNPFVQGDSEENADTLQSARPPGVCIMDI